MAQETASTAVTPAKFGFKYKVTWGIAALGTSFISGTFAALLTMFGIFVALLTVPAAFAFVCIVSGRYLENPSILWMTFSIVAAASAACAFVFFCAVGLQGLLLNLLPARWFARVSVFVQAALFTVHLVRSLK